MEVGEEGEYIYLSLHCHHQNDSCIKMGSEESHFNVSLIARGKFTRLCPQPLKRKDSRSGIEPRSFRLPAYRLTARPNRLTTLLSLRHVFCRLLFRYPFHPTLRAPLSGTFLQKGCRKSVLGVWFHPCLTALARKRPRPVCPKCRCPLTSKHADYTPIAFLTSNKVTL